MIQPFEYLQFETSNICNAKCDYCWSQNHDKDRGLMSLEDIELILKMCGVRKLNDIRPFLNGDPLLEPRMPLILAKIKEYTRQRTCFYTNASYTKHRHFLTDPNLDEVHFTISAATPEMYQAVYKSQVPFEEVVRNVGWFAERKRSDQRWFIHFVIIRKNINDVARWKDIFGGLGAELIVAPIVTNRDNVAAIEARQGISDEQMENLASTDGAAHHTRTYGMPCAIWNDLTIDWTGHYMQCCMSYHYKTWNYGTIHEKTLDEAWAEIKANKMQNKVCDSCNLKAGNWQELLGLKSLAQIA